MVQLVVKTQGASTLHYLDVSDVSIKGNYSAKEIQDLKSQKSDFTQSFTLPFTKTNNDFFSHFYNVVSVDGSFDSSIKCEADIYVDSNIVFSGYLQLLNVNNATQYYEALVFGVISNIATSLDEKKLNELDLSEFSHLLTTNNVINSWSGNTAYTSGTGQTGEEILYPIADYGYNYNDTTLNGTIQQALNVTKLKPAINVKVLFEKILASIGYTINSTFFATDFFAKQYMTLSTETQTVGTTSQDAFRVGLSANAVITSNTNLIFNDETSTNPLGNFYDLGGNYSSTTTPPYYTIPLTGFHQFTLLVKFKMNNSDAAVAKLFMKKNNDASFSEEIFGSWNGSNYNFFDTSTTVLQNVEKVTNEEFFSLNDQVYFQVQITTSSNELLIYKDATILSLFAAPVTTEGATINLSPNNNIMSTEKQVDFISAICSRYNLIIDKGDSINNQLKIEPAQDYFNAGTSKDWSDKIDMNKDRIIKPTNEFRKERINMSDLEDEDKINEYWQNTFGNAYNSYQADLDGDFGEGDLEINTMFSSWNTTRPQGHNMLIAKLYRWNNNSADFTQIKPKLFAYSGLKNCNAYKFYNTVSGAFTTKVQYPFCNHYIMAAQTVVGTDEDIRFKSKYSPDAQFYVDAQTTTDTYSKCWREYLNTIYSSEARILNAYFYLTPEDIAEFKYNNKIFIENSYYRVNKISAYALGKNVSTKVELIKIINNNLTGKSFNILGCDLTWASSNINGTTVWQNELGATVNPTQTCCEVNNLTFDNNQCFWNIPATPDEPNNPPITWDSTANINTTGGKVVVGETASSVAVNDGTQLYLEGTIRRLGKEASNGEVLSWSSATNQTAWVAQSSGGTPAGSNTQIQFNDGGVFGGNSNFVFDKSSGNVGIGTTSPSEKLHVDGKVRANSWFQGNGGSNTLWSNASTGVLLQTIGSTANNNDSKIYFRNHGTTVRATFDMNNGNATFVGRVMSNTHFQSSDSNATLSATGTGNIFLRPNGYSTTSGQVLIETSGNATFAGNIIAPNVISGNQLKILASDFIPDDSGRPLGINDSISSRRYLETFSSSSMYATKEIPFGQKATEVIIYGNDTPAVTVYELQIDDSGVVSKGTGVVKTAINITDVPATATNYLMIEVSQTSSSQIFGGKITLANI